MAEVRFSENAMKDMESIAAYIARDSEFHAAKQVEQFLHDAQYLRTFPRGGRMVPEVGHPSLREVIVGNYRMMYRIMKNDLVEILTIHHGARRFPYGRVITGTAKRTRSK
jgi:addiction module RelE/StbE family toxin